MLRHVNKLIQKYPKTDELLSNTLLNVEPSWPPYIFLPIGAWSGVMLAHGHYSTTSTEVLEMATLCTWRYTQGVYRFNQELLQELINTPVTGDIPCSILRRLPEWSVYIVANVQYMQHVILGFWVSLDCDREGNERLSLVYNLGDRVISSYVMLGDWSISEFYNELVENMRDMAVEYNIKTEDEKDSVIKTLQSCLSIILYLCSEQPVVASKEYIRADKKPRTRRIGRQWRLLPAAKIVTHKIGDDVGKQLHEAKNRERLENIETQQKRPHIRRGHWHSFWIGPRDGEKIIIIKWLHPMLIGKH